MSGVNIWRSSKPSSVGQKILPMSRQDREFWEIISQRREAALAWLEQRK